MATKKLTFEEFNLEGKDKNLWRGIMALCDGIQIFSIPYEAKESGSSEKPYYWIKEEYFPAHTHTNQNPFAKPDGKFGKYLRKPFLKKEEAMEKAQEMFEFYVNYFIK